jgi:RNA polymerase sigma-70 factor (ECF subfamily)
MAPVMLSLSSSTSLSLLNRAQQSDPAAWSRLCHLYAPLVYEWCRRAGLQDSDAHDVGQEVFVVVHRRMSDFRRTAPGESFRGWLWGITRNKLREHFRRVVAQPARLGGNAPAVDAAGADSLGDLEASSPGTDAILMRRALELIRPNFDEVTWRAFWRMAIDGQRSTDVASELDLTPGAVRQAKFRILKRLREEFEGLL